MDGFRNVLRKGSLMIKGRSVDMADKLKRPMPEMWQRFFPDPPPIDGQLFFRRHDCVWQELENVLARHAKAQPTSRGGRQPTRFHLGYFKVIAHALEDGFAQEPVVGESSIFHFR